MLSIIRQTLYIKPPHFFPPGCVSIHSTGLRKIVKIYRFAINFWAVRPNIEREDGLSVSFPTWYRGQKVCFLYHIAILFQNQALICTKELLSVLALFARELMLTELWIFR
jgi:hypothetical protein